MMERSVEPGTLEAVAASRHNTLAWTSACSRWAGVGVSFFGILCTANGQEGTSARQEEHCGHRGWQVDCGYVRHLSRETQIRRASGVGCHCHAGGYYQSSRYFGYMNMSYQVTFNG